MTEDNNLSELGGYKGLINSSYKKIWEEIPTIKEENDYDRDSIGFAHWFFFNILNIDEQKIGELITDDYDDWGIDAININNDEDVINSIIKRSITIIKDLVISDQTGKPPATLTKNNLFHRRIIEKLNV